MLKENGDEGSVREERIDISIDLLFILGRKEDNILIT